MEDAAADSRNIEEGKTVEVNMRPPSLLPLPKDFHDSERLQGVRHRPGPGKRVRWIPQPGDLIATETDAAPQH
jgi:hypothetical protein